jgi:hypothetical protein
LLFGKQYIPTASGVAKRNPYVLLKEVGWDSGGPTLKYSVAVVTAYMGPLYKFANVCQTMIWYHPTVRENSWGDKSFGATLSQRSLSIVLWGYGGICDSGSVKSLG